MKVDSFDEMIAKSYNYDDREYHHSPHWSIAKSLFVKNYLCVSGGDSVIPKKIHQIWLGGEVPEKYEYFMQSWKRFHPTWEYRLWTDADAESFGMERIDAYHSSSNMGTRSDIFSYEILRRHGGLYVDTDFECLKPFDDLLHLSFFAGISYDAKFVLYHGLMASIPNHPILERCVNDMGAGYDGNDGTRIMEATGPYHLTRCFISGVYNAPDGVVAFPMEYFYPLPNNKRHDTDPYKYVTDKSLAIHHFFVSWLK